METCGNGTPTVSVVIPVCNEEGNLRELHDKLRLVMGEMTRSCGVPTDSYEIIMIDDGSSDGSWSIVKDLHETDKKVRGLRFSRNFGHHVAISAGLRYARGDAIVLMDGDLQDPPEEIPKLYRKLMEGYDIVYGIRKQRHDPVLKRVTSFMFWWVLRRFSGVDMPQGQTMLRILSRRLVNVLNQMKEYSRFVHGMMAWAGFDVAMMEVEHRARLRGRTKYNIPRLFKLAFHAVTSFSTIPLKLATYVGFLTSFASMMVGLYFIYKKIFFDIPVLGYASIIVSVFFVGGIQLMMLGIFGEYLGRTYQQVQERPLYVLREVL